MTNTDIKKLLAGMHCSKCKKDFDEDSFRLVRQEDGLFVLQARCLECEKGFGIVIMGLNEDEILNSIKDADSHEEADKIGYDDILDAHNYIKNLDENWKLFMETRNESQAKS